MQYLHNKAQLSENPPSLYIEAKKVRKSRGFFKTQNLRSISNYIKELLQNNPSITIK